jgi:hypothetical protein
MYHIRYLVNFCVSGAAVDWYWSTGSIVDAKGYYAGSAWYTPLKRLFTRHWGSVVAGSFLNGFFELPTLLLELLTCHSNTCCARVGTICEQKCCCGYFFDIVRTDAYAYINLAGLPFCNSARECAFNCARSEQFVGSYNPLKHYRFIASLFLTTFAYTLGHFFANWRLINLTWWHEVTLLIVAYAIICWFVNIYADAAEGLSTSFLTEYRYAGDYPYMQQVFPVQFILFSHTAIKFNKATPDPHPAMETAETLISSSCKALILKYLHIISRAKQSYNHVLQKTSLSR